MALDNKDYATMSFLGIFLFVLFGLGPAIFLSFDPSSAKDKKTSHEEEYEQYQQNYSEASELATEVDAARNKYLRELANLSNKVNQPGYQGVLRQQLFWDCDDAFNDYKNKAERLVRFLKRKGYDDGAQRIQDQMRQAKDAYNELKRSVQGY